MSLAQKPSSLPFAQPLDFWRAKPATGGGPKTHVFGQAWSKPLNHPLDDGLAMHAPRQFPPGRRVYPFQSALFIPRESFAHAPLNARDGRLSTDGWAPARSCARIGHGVLV